eukprot:gene25765-31116_t
MSARKTVSISPSAYVKIGLHASKYYYAPVVGYLIGKTGDKVEIVDILPIAHSAPSTSTLEITGELGDKLGSKSSSQVIGLYYAHDSSTAPRPAFVERAFQNLKSFVPSAVYVAVNQDKLADNSKLFVEAQGINGDAASADITLTSSSAATVNQQLNSLLTAAELQQFADFEDHMNSNGSADFRNTFVQV